MTATLDVRHLTTYRYACPVAFGEHRLMLRPRDSHDLRLLETTLTISPSASTRWMHDVFGNSIAIATFSDPASVLSFESTFRIEHYPVDGTELVLDPRSSRWPFAYDADDLPDLRASLELHEQGSREDLSAWASRFAPGGSRDTLELFLAMNGAIKNEFRYEGRDDMGTQAATETLARGSGSCRDFAMLLMEAARSLGIAARFVSGYLYDGSRIGRGDAVVGAGATHAWAELFLPGAGWVEFDPTNAVVGGRDLIRVAVARSPGQAVPVGGSFMGAAKDYLGMEVVVSVTVAPERAEALRPDRGVSAFVPSPDTRMRSRSAS